MESKWGYNGTELAAYAPALGTNDGIRRQERWYREERCWNCAAPRRERKRRLPGRTHSR